MYHQQHITWLDYILINNPDGLLRVLSSFGYSGYNTPQGYEDLREASLEVMDRHGDSGVTSILEAHPEYGAFKDLFAKSHTTFLNASGQGRTLFEKMKKGIKPFDDIFIALSVFSLAYFIIEGVRK